MKCDYIYVAEDGARFSNLKDCADYEAVRGISPYDDVFSGSVGKVANNIISRFEDAIPLCGIGADKEHNELLRRSNINNGLDDFGLIGDNDGVVYLRDDGVKALCDYIALLEKELKESSV